MRDIKQIGTLLAAAIPAALASSASAALIASDSFSVGNTAGDYSVGNLQGQNPSVGSTGFSSEWDFFGSGSTGDLDADTGGLTASLVSGGTLPGLIRTDGNGGSDRNLFREFSSVPASSQYFYSFLLNSGADTDAAFGLTPRTGRNPEPIEGVRVGVDSNDIVLIVDDTELDVLNGYTADATYFVLVSILNDDAGTDTITASVFSDTATDVAATPLGTQTTTGEITGDLTHLNASRQSTNSGAAFTSFDEFRFGTELTDVAVIPEPASAGLVGLGGLLLASRRRRAI
jgi:hypothetical protein